ncbi:acyl-CoA dehydrogenase family protein [Novosphingobium pentaromativorans]|nr:acyl-CoA dehydrogenase family protein [Novosphingobium pentaromativorans]AIT80045.1 hypothetical protein JI59_09810 [Novosphingobium pentaromativorans US6-1]
MALVPTEAETMLADAARGLLDRSAPVSAFRALRDSGDPLKYSRDLLAKLAQNGLVAANIAEEDGGVGMGACAAGIIAEQAAHTLAAAPLLSASLAAELIGRLGSEEQRRDLLGAIMAGELVVAVALDEAVRHDPAKLATVAAGAGDACTLTGRKTAVIDAVGANRLLVSARAGDTVRLFLVDPATQGCTISAIDTIDGRNIGVVALDGAAGLPVGEDAGDAIAATLDLGRALLGAELLGLADHAFDATVAYLKEREQFGRKIGTYQALQHRTARLYARLDLARGVVLKALRAIDEAAAEASLLASLSKAVMTELCRDVMVEAVQMHGGIGVTDEFDIGLYYKRARVSGELLGDDRFHVERLARLKWEI